MNFKINDNTNPKVSILGACYNHEEYIGEAIESILNQSFEDFELILIDDASSDKSVEKIEKYLDDVRIKFIKHEKNMGISRTFNEALEYATGEYIALMPGDDIHLENKLELQVNFLDTHLSVGAVFGKMEVIKSEYEKNNSMHFKFDQTDLCSNRFEYLNEFFYRGNFLPAPTEMIRKEILDEVGLYNPSLHNLQDMDNHVKVLLNHEIFFMDETLCYYRWHENNASAPNEDTNERSKLEMYTILDNYLKIDDVKLLKKIFGNEIYKYGIPTPETINYFISRLIIENGVKYKKEWGYSVLLDFLSDDLNFEKVEEYGFNYKEYLKIVKLITSTVRILFIDSGNGFNQNESIIDYFNVSINNEVEFNLNNFSNINRLRFDPIEWKFCNCTITCVETDIKNCIIKPINSLNNDDLVNNVFFTHDPQYLITGNFSNATYIKIKYDLNILELSDISRIINEKFQKLKKLCPDFLLSDMNMSRKLHIDKGLGFKIEDPINQMFNLNNLNSASYNLKDISNIKRLCFTPIEGHLCACQIIDIKTDILNFKIKSINSINNLRNGEDVFLTIIPQYEISGNFAKASFLEITYTVRILNDSEISKYANNEINKLKSLLYSEDKIINQPDKLN